MNPSPIEKIAAAFCAMIFAAIALFGLIQYGDHPTRALAIAAAVLGVVAQYSLQGTAPVSRVLSVYAAAIGFAFTIAALVAFIFSN